MCVQFKAAATHFNILLFITVILPIRINVYRFYTVWFMLIVWVVIDRSAAKL